MGYKSVLVCLDQEQNVSLLISTAISLSDSGNAQIIGMHTMPGIHIASAVNLHLPVTLYSEIDRKHQLQAEQIKRAFEKASSSADREWVWLQCKGQHQFDFRHYTKMALTCDVVITAQSELLIKGIDLQRDLLLGAGTPVMTIPVATTPRNKADSNPVRVALAWNATLESARAVRDALPVMRRAANVDIICVDVKASAHSSATEMVNQPGTVLQNYLTFHGIYATVFHPENSRSNAAQCLLNHCQSYDCDLLIMGGFSHSRLYNAVMGASTEEVLRKSQIPVLLSH